MAISMYHASVPVFLQLLGGLKGTLEKAGKHMTEKKWDEAKAAWQTYLDWANRFPEASVLTPANTRSPWRAKPREARNPNPLLHPVTSTSAILGS